MTTETAPVWVQFKDTSEPLFPFRPGEMREARRNGPHYHIDTEAGTYTVVANQVEEVPDPTAPAPLDPSKVKAGDTVTLQGTTAKIEGEVSNTYNDGLGLVLQINHIRFRVTGAEAWTLTAHTPAPEPEPEWEPGTVARLSLLDDDLAPRVYRTGIGTWHAIDDTRSWSDADVEYVHEMVVIDPARVDVEELVTAFVEAVRNSQRGGPVDGILAILTHLGLEAS